MLSLSLYAMLKLSKTTSPQKLFDHDCITLYTFLNLIQTFIFFHFSLGGGDERTFIYLKKGFNSNGRQLSISD